MRNTEHKTGAKPKVIGGSGVLRSLLALSLVLLLTACSDSGNGVGGESLACDPSDQLVYEGTTYTEAESSSFPPACDPQVLANHFDSLGAWPGPVINVLVSLSYDGSSFDNVLFNLLLYDDTTGTYPYAGTSIDSGEFDGSFEDSLCLASGGSVTISRVESAGGKVEGSYTIDLIPIPGVMASCPTSISGSFSATRNDL